MGDIRELQITTIGRQGDGIARTEEGDIFIPLTLPDEKVIADVDGDRGTLEKIVTASEKRRVPLCKHYSICGGCSLQHMSEENYFDWKRNVVKQAFSKAGIDIEPEEVKTVSHNSRRRAVMEIRRTKKTIQFGFHGRKSSDIVDIEECFIIRNEILNKLSDLKILLRPLLSRKGISRVYITATDNGLDISITDVNKELNAEIREDLAQNSRKFGVVRLTINGETMFVQAPPALHFAEVKVEIAPGSFLQAVQEAEHHMRDIILEGVGKAKKVADLFCGTGTFTFPLAKKAEVTAIEYDQKALKQLKHAFDNAQGLKPVNIELRDLARDPLTPKELTEFEAVVFDPPRAGAKSQAEALARSTVPTIVAVSCNPATMARDIRILIDGGYKLHKVTPIDQFLYSAHVEAVAVLTK